MDMIFRDDECRVRNDNASANFAVIRHMAHNLLRKAPGKQSLRLRRKAAAWDDDFLVNPIVASPITRFPSICLFGTCESGCIRDSVSR